MSEIFEWPIDIFPQANAGGYCDVVTITDTFTSSRSGAQQVVLRGPAEVWHQKFTIITHGEHERDIEKLFSQLRGSLNILRCADLFNYSLEIDGDRSPLYRGSTELFSDGSRFSDGFGWRSASQPVITLSAAAVAGDSSISLSIVNNSPDLLRLGDRISIDDSLYKIIDYDFNAATATIHPPLRKNAVLGETVVGWHATGLWRLTDSQLILSEHIVNSSDGPIRTREITLVEAFV